jgi:hypothetical protein
MNPVEVIKWERDAVLKVVEEEVCRESRRRGYMVTSSDPVVVNHVTQYILRHGEGLRQRAETALADPMD